jgi:hypothetical protein
MSRVTIEQTVPIVGGVIVGAIRLPEEKRGARNVAA